MSRDVAGEDARMGARCVGAEKVGGGVVLSEEVAVRL